MTGVIVAGVDLSLTSTGIAIASVHQAAGSPPVMTPDSDRIRSAGRAGATLEERGRRLDEITDAVVVRICGADLVVIEGPSLGQARQGGQHDRAGLWHLVVKALRISGIPVAEVPPSVRSKYATGAGNAGKDAVLAAAVKRYPDWDITGNDVADAVILAAMGCRHLGHPIDSLPQIHLSAMTKVRWPDTTEGNPTA